MHPQLSNIERWQYRHGMRYILLAVLFCPHVRLVAVSPQCPTEAYLEVFRQPLHQEMEIWPAIQHEYHIINTRNSPKNVKVPFAITYILFILSLHYDPETRSSILTSFPESAMQRSSLPRFRFQMRCISILISACNASHL